MKALDWGQQAAQARAYWNNRISTGRIVGVNSAWLLLARVALQAQAVLLTILAARRLGQAGYGQYSLIVSLVFLANVLTTFGTDTLLIRQVAREHRADIPEVGAALTLQLFLSMLVILGIWLWTGLSSHWPAEVIDSMRLYSLSLFPLAFFSVFSAIFRGLERMELFLITSLTIAGVQIVGVWLAFQAGSRLTGLIGVLLAVQVIATFLAGWLCKPYIKSSSLLLGINPKMIACVLRAVWPMALLSLTAVSSQRSGIFALSAWGNDANTGLFSAAARMIEGLKLGHMAILGAILPALARVYSHPSGGNSQEAHLFRLAVATLSGLGLVLAVGLALLAGPIVSLFYGPGYTASVEALHILAWSLVPYSISSVLSVDMVAKGQEKRVTGAVMASLAGAMVLYWLLIPAYGLAGACAASLVGECILVGCLSALRMKNSILK